MKTRHASLLKSLFTVAAIACTLLLDGTAQKPVGGTVVENYASATYKDRKGKNYGTVSNAVTFTVAKVAGLTITPDGGKLPSSVNLGQKAVDFRFRVTNTGNFADQVRFLANGASIRVIGPAVVASAVIDLPASGSGIDIHKNGLDVLHSLPQNGSVEISVKLDISATAPAGSTIQVFLGDATTGTNFDNVSANKSANEVRTVSTDVTNGVREARGDISATVSNDEQLRVNLTVPKGPVVLGSDITYEVNACNDGGKNLLLPYAVVPIPDGTRLTNTTSLPTGTRFTTEPLSVSPREVDRVGAWVTTAPSDLSSITRISFPFFSSSAPSLASGACSAMFSFNLTVTTNNASKIIYGIVDAFAPRTPSAAELITDQSGDTFANKGDGNANFDEPKIGETASATQGFQQPTLLVGPDVLIGPNGAPNATGPTSSNDDYTNLSMDTQVLPPDGTTNAAEAFVFTNTVRNNSSANDTFVLTAPTAPAGATVEISTDEGTTYTAVGGGSGVNLAVVAKASASINVKVTLPAGLNILTGYDTVIRATSQSDSTKTNETINRIYTGFIRLTKNVDTTSADPSIVSSGPGAQVAYAIKYENISSTGGVGSIGLTANNLVITEDGNAAPNNWGTTTDHVVGSVTDTSGGAIAGDVADSSLLTVTITSLPPGASGTFTFRRRIKK